MTRAETAAFLREHDNYCILTHRRPDGDTIGSSAALCLGLRAMGKTAWLLRNPQFTPRFAAVLEGLVCEDVPDEATIVSVDVAAPDLLPIGREGAGCASAARHRPPRAQQRFGGAPPG